MSDDADILEPRALDEMRICVDAIGPPAAPAETWDRIDGVDLGIPESERRHPPYGCFTRHYGSALTDYAGPENVQSDGPVVHFRNWAQITGMRLFVPAAMAARPCVVQLLIRTFPVGSPPGPPRPIRVRYEAGATVGDLGEIEVPADGAWRRLRVPFPPPIPAWFDLVLDDRESVASDKDHWGRALACVRLLASRADE